MAKDLSVRYLLTVLAVFLMTVGSAMASVALVVLVPDQRAGPLVETFSTTFKMGFGAFIGLLGGKVA